MNAAKVMTREVVTVRPDTRVGGSPVRWVDHKISAIPVIDDDRHVVGIVSEGDLLASPPPVARAWWLRFFNEGAVCLEEIATAGHLKARDVMIKPVVTVVDQTPVDVVATLMRCRRVKRVPVLREGKIVGIVSRADLLEATMRRTAMEDQR
jgi:CBS-domain-containing membrane protein